MQLVPDLRNRVALVTGASRGICRSVALALAATGADVAINYRMREGDAEAVVAAVRGIGRRAIAIGADVASSEAVRTMMSRVEGELGSVDILVNSVHA
jgi:3-oxoacyl-[acyl-carrier protein] reductase